MVRQIAKLQELNAKRVALKYETAQQIRTLLDRAREQWVAEDWDSEDVESEILELVTAEGDS